MRKGRKLNGSSRLLKLEKVSKPEEIWMEGDSGPPDCVTNAPMYTFFSSFRRSYCVRLL